MQVRDKYLAMAKETDDRVLAENYNQAAEHYNRTAMEQNTWRPNTN